MYSLMHDRAPQPGRQGRSAFSREPPSRGERREVTHRSSGPLVPIGEWDRAVDFERVLENVARESPFSRWPCIPKHSSPPRWSDDEGVIQRR